MGNKLRAGCPCLQPKEVTLDKKYDLRDGETLGQGTFAIVYKGYNRKTKQEVAIKIIDKANSRRDLLNTEIWILQNFGNHPNIVNLYDMYETEEEVQLVMELMLGGELFDMLDENGPYGEADAAKYLKSIASGLAYLHAGNVAHRDLKPENLLLTSKGPEGVLKISDFGLAKILIDEELMKVACGTWIYCAPEVLLLKVNKTGEYCIKCDVFSVGCILFIMLGGYHPFDLDGSDDEEMMQDCILSDTWDFEDPAWANVSNTGKELMESMMKWDPAERLTVQQVLDHPWTRGKVQYGKLSESIDQDLKKTRLSLKSNRESAVAQVRRESLRRASLNSKDLPSFKDNVPLLKQPAIPEDAVLRALGPSETGGSISRPEPSGMLLDGGTGGPAPTKPYRPRGSTDGPRASQLRVMPKKHVPHAAAVVETCPKADEVALELKGAGAAFDPKANEARWEKYMKEKDQKKKPDGLAPLPEIVEEPEPAAPEANAESATADPSPSSDQDPPATDGDLKLLGTAIEEAATATKSPAASEKKAAKASKAKAKAKAGAGDVKKFDNVAEWKAKQAPKLLKEGGEESDARSESKKSTRKSTKAKPKKEKAEGSLKVPDASGETDQTGASPVTDASAVTDATTGS